MADPTLTTAASSPAAVSAADTLNGLSHEARAHWQLTGELPDDPTPAAESSPAEPESSPAAETSASAQVASEPTAPKKSNAETRKAELAREIQDLLKQRDALRRELTTPAPRAPEPTPTPAVPSGPAPLAQVVQSPDLAKPPLTDAEFFAAYPDATVSDLSRYLARYELLADRAEQAAQQTMAQRDAAYAARIKAAVEKEPGFWDSISADVKDLNPQTSVLAREIMQSPEVVAILKHFTAHPEELGRLTGASDATVARAIGRLEATLATSSVPPVPAAKAASSAPAPGTTLGRQAAIPPVDDAESALASGDMRRYKAIMNRREVSA